jgi:trehalose-phosphatase
MKNRGARTTARRRRKPARSGDFEVDRIKIAEMSEEPGAGAIALVPPHPGAPGNPRPLFRAWPEIRARIKAAKELAVFLDFDGTLVGLRRRPGDVRAPRSMTRVLESLARHENVLVAIVSGRRLRDLQGMFEAQGVHLIGLHGAESERKKTALSKTTRLALGHAKRDARSQLGILPGIWLEDKILSLAVHYRGASPAIVREAYATLLGILAPLHGNLSIMKGEKVWEILPREIGGKGAAIQELLAGRDGETLAIYAGDDAADEAAFAAIPDQITVQVGGKGGTCARYFLRSPAEVLRFLVRLERELQ